MGFVTLMPVIFRAETSTAIFHQLVTEKPCRFACLACQEFLSLSYVVMLGQV